MKYLEFDSIELMNIAGLSLLSTYMEAKSKDPHGVMLTGGNTVKDLYSMIAASPLTVDSSLRIVLSDERYVSEDSPDSNFGSMLSMLTAIGVERTHVLSVDTKLPLEMAADDYDSRLRVFSGALRDIKLAILGVGNDGHVASLFSHSNIDEGVGRYAIATSSPDGVARISVTTELLSNVSRTVFFVQGKDKKEIVDRVLEEDVSLIAVQAAKRIKNCELWYAF